MNEIIPVTPRESLRDNALERHEVALRQKFGDALVEKAFRHELAARLIGRRPGSSPEAVLNELKKQPPEVMGELYRLLQAEELLSLAGYRELEDGTWEKP